MATITAAVKYPRFSRYCSLNLAGKKMPLHRSTACFSEPIWRMFSNIQWISYLKLPFNMLLINGKFTSRRWQS